MNTNERKPLLSDERIEDLAHTATSGFYADEFASKHNLGGPMASFIEGACCIRSQYENLITTGKLRVVEEVERVPYSSKNRNLHGEPFDTCSGCGHDLHNSFPKYCQECGNPIKKNAR